MTAAVHDQNGQRKEAAAERAGSWTNGFGIKGAAARLSAMVFGLVLGTALMLAPMGVSNATPLPDVPAAPIVGQSSGSGGGWFDWLFELFSPRKLNPTDDIEHVIIGLDLSKSNPLIMDDNFATKVARFVGDEIETLPIRSRITLRTFGVDLAAANSLGRNYVIRTSLPADRVAASLETAISDTPGAIRRGRIQAQDFTNILSFLYNMAQIVDCDDYKTTIILATDAIEDSELAKLNRADGRLPPAPDGLFAGCHELLILGIGQGRGSVTTTSRLRREWQRWANEAGFERFRGLNNW